MKAVFFLGIENSWIAACEKQEIIEWMRMKLHNQVASIVYTNMFTMFGLETSRSKWDTPPKVADREEMVNHML